MMRGSPRLVALAAAPLCCETKKDDDDLLRPDRAGREMIRGVAVGRYQDPRGSQFYPYGQRLPECPA